MVDNFVDIVDLKKRNFKFNYLKVLNIMLINRGMCELLGNTDKICTVFPQC